MQGTSATDIRSSGGGYQSPSLVVPSGVFTLALVPPIGYNLPPQVFLFPQGDQIMATVSIRGQRTRVEQTDKEQPDKAAGFSPKQMWRGRRRLLIVLAGLAIVVWLLPAIVVHTPLFRWILGKATADLNGTLTVQSASLGWFSPIAVGGVEVKDAQGKSVLTLPAASGDRSLVAILCNYTNLGTFTLDRPKVSILLRDDGSNVEDVLAKYLAPQPTSSPMKIGLALKVVDGSVSVSEQLTGQGWQVSKLEVTFDMSQGTAGPMKGEVSADLTDAKHPGNLSAGVEMASAGNKATLSAKQIPLALFRPLLARFAPGTKLSGWLSSTLGVSWGGTAGKYSVQADATADGLLLSMPSLQGDTLQLDRLHAVSQVSWQGQRVEIQKTQVDCDLGTVSLESTLQLGDNGGLSLGTMLSQQYELRGQVDLARLARLLPASLHLRQQVQINSGQATLALSSRPGQQGMAWDGQFDVANLTATTGNGPVTWDRPISVI